MSTAFLCCEGAACNAGFSADDRMPAAFYAAGDWPHLQSLEQREADAKRARAEVTQRLRVTPHALVGSDGRGQIYACEVCGHRRVFGGTQYTAYQGQSFAVSR